MRATTIEFDRDLLQRYGGRGPRYTSYPPASQFHEGFGEVDYRRQVAQSNEYPIPAALSLYVHIPFCESLCYYCGCTKVVTRHREQADDYLQKLFVEIALQGSLFDADRSVQQLHLGGGTPNFLDPREMRSLMDCLRAHFSMSGNTNQEYSIEVDPRGATQESIFQMAELGFNRISFGVQDFDPRVQEAVNRIQPAEVTERVVRWAREAGFGSVSIDLIYGLPFQNLETFDSTLEQTLAIRPDRLAVYSYAHLPEMFKAQRLIKAETLPSPDEKLALLELTVEKLPGAGYRYIGMDHFALADDELVVAQDEGQLHRNFQGYSTHAYCDLVGLGISAISNIADCYSQNEKHIKTYGAFLDEGVLPIVRGIELSADDRLRRDVIQGLMCDGVVAFPLLERKYAISFEDYFSAELEVLGSLEEDGLVTLGADAIEVTPGGWLLVRAIASVFDGYLPLSSGQRFSSFV